MAGKTAKSSIPTTSANKDLSCLRCRKKKAKCSKTRPTCTRCARSNQPCEYPDAPPNLTDLSQKVLTLYDTLRELEGEFLVKYMKTRDEDMNEDEEDHEHNTIDENNAYSPQHNNNPNTTSTLDNHHQHDNQISIKQESTIDEPAGWSMSLTSNGLSIQAVTRNLNEFNEFAKLISRQIIRDFGSEYLPKLWDPDAEGYFEEESDTEELDEDEYLVTVPVFSTCSLLFNGERPTNHVLPLNDHQQQEQQRKEVLRTLLNGADTLVTLIQSHFPHMLKHLDLRYTSLLDQQNTSELSTTTATSSVSHHLVILMLQLKSFLPLDSTNTVKDSLTQICILTAYVVSVTLLPPIPNVIFPPLPTSLWRDCAEYATMLLVDLILSKGDAIPSYPIILCAILLAWINAELTTHDFKADTMVHIALRVLCGSDWENEEPTWQILIAALLYLDIYSATFQFRKPQLRGEGVIRLWKAAMQMREPARWETSSSFREAGIILEARLMSLLNKVISLFYQVDEDCSPNQKSSETKISVRKIDVDEVLTLVRDTELWEQELPDWAKWNNNNNYNETEQKSLLGLKMHMHMIHNIVKILLFRPFSTTLTEEDSEQTFTKTTFLDMSISSADRLTSCLLNVHEYGFTGFWTKAAGNLVRDVSMRVLKMFDKDEDIVNQLDKIQSLLQQAEESQ